MSAGEILLILFIYLLLFGAKGVPSLAQTLGKAVYQFRNATKDVQEEIMKSANDIRKEAAANVRLDQMDIDDTPLPPKQSPQPVNNTEPAKTPVESKDSSLETKTEN